MRRRRIRYDFGDGEPWDFIADPERGFPPFGATKLAVGAAKRVHETREIVSGNGTYLIANAMGRPEPLARG